VPITARKKVEGAGVLIEVPVLYNARRLFGEGRGSLGLRPIRLKEAVSIDVFVGTLIATMLVFMAVGVVVLLAAGVEELAENLRRKKKKQQRETAGPES
jgi:hypothetical protein